MAETISLIFSGLEADENRLDLYDASISNYGLARVVSILGHYYVTGKIIQHAPKSDVRVYIHPPEDGSFKQTIAAAAIGGIIAVPPTVFITRTIDSWVPNPDPQMEQVIDLLQEQNKLLRQQQDLPKEPTEEELRDKETVDDFLEKNQGEVQVIRSITANSFKDIFRPVGRSAGHVGITYGELNQPLTAINPRAVDLIESERRDQEEVVLVGVVNSFSRSSKTGIVFSRKMDRGVPIADVGAGKLPPGDDYSWSQYAQEPIEMTGTYVYWFDGRIKRFLVESTRRLPQN